MPYIRAYQQTKEKKKRKKNDNPMCGMEELLYLMHVFCPTEHFNILYRDEIHIFSGVKWFEMNSLKAQGDTGVWSRTRGANIRIWLVGIIRIKRKKNLIVDGQLPKARASKIQNSFPEYNKI